MQEFEFSMMTAKAADTGDIELKEDPERKTIKIATDWWLGEDKERQKEPYHDTGYIGKGSSKRGIYVSRFATFLHTVFIHYCDYLGTIWGHRIRPYTGEGGIRVRGLCCGAA